MSATPFTAIAFACVFPLSFTTTFVFPVTGLLLLSLIFTDTVAVLLFTSFAVAFIFVGIFTVFLNMNDVVLVAYTLFSPDIIVMLYGFELTGKFKFKLATPFDTMI